MSRPPTKLANQTDFMNPMVLDWQLSLNAGTTWLGAAQSDTRVYVTLNNPTTTPLYETVIDIACRNALAKTDPDQIVTSIFADFTDQSVTRKPIDGYNQVDGHQLTYYQDWQNQNVTTAALLASGDGQCGAWAKLFIDALGAHGVNYTNEYAIIRYDNAAYQTRGFLIKNWSLSPGGGVSGHPEFAYLNIPPASGALIGSTSYNWRFSEANDATGIEGQGVQNPASLFDNHQLVKITTTTTTTYYDPSYGLSYANRDEIDNQGIDGYLAAMLWPVDEPAVNLDLNNDGDSNDLGVTTFVFLVMENPSGNQLGETNHEYP